MDAQYRKTSPVLVSLIDNKAFSRLKKMNKLFLLTVVIPTFFSIIYFGVIASDVYVSESRFVVRTPQRQTGMTGIGSLLQGVGFSTSNEDNYTVQDFMLSRDAMAKLDEDLSLRDIFGSSDLFSRFNPFRLDDSSENLYKYYQGKVEISLNTSSSISTMLVRAYTSEDAHRINAKLLEMGEELVNQLNARGRQDMIGFATDEVRSAEKKATDASLALSAYRNKHVVFDPERQSALQLQQITKLQDELISAKGQLVQIKNVSPQNPQIPALQLRIQTIQRAMDEQMAKVAGGNSSLTNKAAEYERLLLEQQFAERQLAGALAGLESARNEAQRKQLYLERIVQPNKPDEAIEPVRLKGIVATFLLGLVLWGILTILIAGVKEHRD